MLNVFRNLDGNGAWPQTRATWNVLCLSRARGVVLAISNHGEFAGSVDGTWSEERLVYAESRDGGSSECSDTNSTASLDVVSDRREVAQAASSVQLRQNEMGRLGVYVHSARESSQHTQGCLDGTRAECDRPVGLAHSAK